EATGSDGQRVRRVLNIDVAEAEAGRNVLVECEGNPLREVIVKHECGSGNARRRCRCGRCTDEIVAGRRVRVSNADSEISRGGGRVVDSLVSSITERDAAGDK